MIYTTVTGTELTVTREGNVISVGTAEVWDTFTLREWAECSFFDIRDEFNSARSIRRGTVHQLKTKLRGLMGKQAEDISRHVLVAEAVTRKETFKPVPQDSDLAEFQIR